MKASFPSPAAALSIGTISPARARAAAAEKMKVEIVRATSTRAVDIGLADSRAIV
ncbi:unannotated protein [freshwater metagenome]|uniref:Unannotated protein n=1 Tax=freshwater metagenome TaxID=449393 RepID=A0A6J7RY91_9ZZZZ